MDSSDITREQAERKRHIALLELGIQSDFSRMPAMIAASELSNRTCALSAIALKRWRGFFLHLYSKVAHDVSHHLRHRPSTRILHRE